MSDELVDRLETVDGIGAGTAETIAEEFDDRENLRNVVADLPPGFSPSRFSGLEGFGPVRARKVAIAIDESGVLEDGGCDE